MNRRSLLTGSLAVAAAAMIPKSSWATGSISAAVAGAYVSVVGSLAIGSLTKTQVDRALREEVEFC